MSLDYSIIGERIQKVRKNKKITQEQLAEKLEVSVAFLSRIERGSIKINLNRLEQICDVLDTSVSYVLEGTTIKSKNYLNEEFSSLLKNCPPEKLKLIYDIAKVIVK